MSAILLVGARLALPDGLASLVRGDCDLVRVPDCQAAIAHLRSAAPPALICTDLSRWDPSNLRILREEFSHLTCVDVGTGGGASDSGTKGTRAAPSGPVSGPPTPPREPAEDLMLMLAHDLRAAVAVMGAYATVMLGDMPQDEAEGKGASKQDRQRGMLERIRGTSERLVGTVDDIVHLMWRGPTSGLHFETAAPDELIHAAMADLAGAAEERRQSVTCEADADVEGRSVDRHLVLLALRNLLHNAIKYTQPGGRITLKGTTLPNGLSFTVQDNGRGIDTDVRRTLFTNVRQLSSPSAQSGSGIGLWSAKKVVELHGGSIWVESTPGQGSMFGFTVRAGGHAGSQRTPDSPAPSGALPAS